MKRILFGALEQRGVMPAAGTEMAPDKGSQKGSVLSSPGSVPGLHPGGSALPSYLTVSCVASGLLAGTFLVLLALGFAGRAVSDLSMWVWVTLFLGAAGVFSTSIVRIRDLRAHAV
jgi:hypothetical protein